jgi:mannose-6-phosphate isomerase-like protein (cupin superfamily)
MRILLTPAIGSTTAVLLIAAAVSLGGGVPAAVHYIGHDKVTEVMSKGGPIVSDPGLVVLAQRRAIGPAEYHDRTNHVFIMVEGEATLVVGGTMVEPKRTEPYQMFKEIPTKTVAYYAVNIESE